MNRVHAAVFALGLAALWPFEAGAALGGTTSTVETDQVHMHAQRQQRAESGYTVHALTLSSGTVVREFVATSGGGQVFAVAWHGPFMPDLKQLLGDSFGSFVEAAGRPGTGRGAVTVNRPGLVIHSGGRMRAFSGFAYLPSQLPEGVQVENLR